MLKFVHHHALEDVCLLLFLLLVLGVIGWREGYLGQYLVIDVVENIFPERVEDLGGDEEDRKSVV